MSKVTNVTYTNRDQSSSRSASMYDVKPVSAYSRQYGNGNTTYLNRTAASDATEKVRLFSGDHKTVETTCAIANPSKRRLAAADKNSTVMEGISYGAFLDTVYVETDPDDSSYRVDYPQRWIISSMHENIGSLTDAQLGESLMRLVSWFKNPDNTWNFSALRGKFTNIEEN